MFDAPEPLYDDLFDYLRDNFLLPDAHVPTDTDSYIPKTLQKDPNNPNDVLRDANGNPEADLKPLKSFERGIIYQTPRNANKSLYPMAYLEWGKTSKILGYQSPHGYTYNLTYPLCLLTFQNDREPDNAVFTKKTDTGFYGIGDLVTMIVRCFWADHKKSKFFSARHRYNPELSVPGNTLAADETDWWVIDWTLEVANELESQPGETDMLAAGGSRQNNPLVRGTQINLIFEVFERDALC